MPSRGGKRTWEPTTLTQSPGERADAELFAAQKQIKDLEHQLDVIRRTTKVATTLLTRVNGDRKQR